MGSSDTRAYGRPRQWTEARIEAKLRQVSNELGRWPSNKELQRAGLAGLAKAIIRYGGSTYWARRLGFQPYRGLPSLYWTDERIERELAPFLAGRAHFPTAAEFEEAGLRNLRTAVRFRGGPAMWAAKFGLPAPRPGRRPPNYS